ncbi:hypothetical protein [Pedobacter steynii]|uniref:Outer membrane protein beta-barrel domain-containing protein n=1 Tax=Pedobacter steynii TaxID=430522 RepID=A0A1D7QLG5_9SPHI|nr:hypothetical protein [Pedobacter steynii]AOM79453.1 hypothetical protein BFS30_21190 [Pedobacter steynii]
MRSTVYKTRFSPFFGGLIFLIFINNYGLQASAQTYPKIAGYVGIVHPIVTFSSDGAHTNFKDSYVVGMPIGINIWKSATIGFSTEIVPFVKATGKSSKVNNVLFHPGILVALGGGFTFAGRAAFETSGRYGLTPVLNKVIKKNKGSSYFIAVPLPARFGNELPSSFGIGFQFGISF